MRSLRAIPYDGRMRARVVLLTATLLAGIGSGCAVGESRRVVVEGSAQLYVRERRSEHGAGPAGTIVVPGASWMEHDLEPLVGAQRLVFYDPRGRGRSSPVPPGGELSLERDVADLEELRVALGLERMTLLGWAYNGGIALRYALAYPRRVERLVLVAPLPPARHPYWDELTERFRERADPSALARIEELRLSGAHDRDPYAYCRAVTEAFLRASCHVAGSAARMKSDPCVLSDLDADATARRGERLVAALGDWDWTAELATLDVPTLLVHGREDPAPAAGSQAYAAALPDARLLLLDDTGHLPWIERPELFFPPVLDFLAGGDARPHAASP